MQRAKCYSYAFVFGLINYATCSQIIPLFVNFASVEFLKKEYKRLQHPDFSKTIVENVALTVQRDIQRVLPLEWQTVDVYGIQNVCVDD